MQKYIARRLLLMIPTLMGVTIILFIMLRTMPGSIVDLIAGDFGVGDPEVKKAIIAEFGLDENWPTQYVKWLGRISTGDFGNSLMSGRSVNGELASRLPVTAELGVLTILISTVVAIPVGIISAIRQDSASDYAGRTVAIGFLAAPNFWIALLLIVFAGRYFTWGVPPTQYTTLTEDPIANLKFMLLPALILGISGAGGTMRFVRSSMLEVLRQDYVRTATAKGLRERTVILRHVLKNALIPVVTVIGASIPFIVGGTIIIETIYSIPGIGRFYFSAIGNLDFPVVQAIVIITAIVVVLANLAVDISYSWLDPRIRYN
jgi:peptide/nickel transport system permease protein